MKKTIPMPAMIAIGLLVLGLLGFFAYRASAPPAYVTTKETGRPAWVDKWEKDHPGQGYKEPAK